MLTRYPYVFKCNKCNKCNVYKIDAKTYTYDGKFVALWCNKHYTYYTLHIKTGIVQSCALSPWFFLVLLLARSMVIY